MASERLQKILARGGFASRRAAERLIAEGRVRVNGRVVTELGTRADPRHDRVEVDGTRVVAEQPVYVVLHKPRGVVTTMSDPEGRPTVRQILAPIGARVYPVGRLDFATSGVLLATNDGDFADALMHPKKAVPKTYVLKVRGVMEAEDLDRWRSGVRLEDGVTLPAQAKLLRHEGDKTWLELTIREGRNQQIRRMGEATGFPVMRLSRVSFAGITGEGLRPGAWRPLSREELAALKKEYGVPKRIPAAPEETEGPGRGRAKRGVAPKRVHDSPSPERGAGRGRARGARGDSSTQPRYGGGSPGRRGYDVREDWGGGAGRGRSGGTDRQAPDGDDAPRGELGGRHGRSRTTGTGGGIGGRGGGEYRLGRGRR
jgi:23S rRNA pseudouridine2605 synthase